MVWGPCQPDASGHGRQAKKVGGWGGLRRRTSSRQGAKGLDTGGAGRRSQLLHGHGVPSRERPATADLVGNLGVGGRPGPSSRRIGQENPRAPPGPEARQVSACGYVVPLRAHGEGQLWGVDFLPMTDSSTERLGPVEVWTPREALLEARLHLMS